MAEASGLISYGEKSQVLQELLRAHGFSRGDGVSTAGIRLVSQVAKAHGLRDWPHTRSLEDYDALIIVVRDYLDGLE